jgi:alpha-glucosidase
VTWRDWYTHDVVNVTSGDTTTLSAPLGHINVHLRDGSIILLHANPAYTITETRAGSFSLIVSLDANGSAAGSAFLDDGVSFPVVKSRTLTFTAAGGKLQIRSQTGEFDVEQRLESVILLGVEKSPKSVSVNGERQQAGDVQFEEGKQKVVLTRLSVDLNKNVLVEWD